jgi:hypothetical protein
MIALIPEKRAMVVWNTIGTGVQPSDDVVVHEYRDAKMTLGTHDCSAGACGAGWCEADHPRDNPAGLFASIIFDAPAPASRPVIRAWLEQFAKIDSCEWARQMLMQMVEFDRRNRGAE